jgi:hypothetical protein
MPRQSTACRDNGMVTSHGVLTLFVPGADLCRVYWVYQGRTTVSKLKESGVDRQQAKFQGGDTAARCVQPWRLGNGAGVAEAASRSQRVLQRWLDAVARGVLRRFRFGARATRPHLAIRVEAVHEGGDGVIVQTSLCEIGCFVRALGGSPV